MGVLGSPSAVLTPMHSMGSNGWRQRTNEGGTGSTMQEQRGKTPTQSKSASPRYTIHIRRITSTYNPRHQIPCAISTIGNAFARRAGSTRRPLIAVMTSFAVGRVIIPRVPVQYLRCVNPAKGAVQCSSQLHSYCSSPFANMGQVTMAPEPVPY